MDPLDSRQLRAFQELAEQGSFTTAAQNLHLTQSAVSHSIKALENAVGCRLFDRLGKSVKLTLPGEALLPHANRILARMQLAQEELNWLNRPGFGRLRIGATVTVSEFVLPSALCELRERFPDFEISIRTEDTRPLLRMLEDGEIDVAVGLKTEAAERCVFQPLFDDEVLLALSPGHELAKFSQLPIDSIASQVFIFYDRDSETYRLAQQWFAGRKIRPRAPFQVGSMAAIKEMARLGVGIGFLSPWVALEELEAGSLVVRRLPAQRFCRAWGLYTDRNREPQEIEGIFSGICQRAFAEIQQRTDEFFSGMKDSRSRVNRVKPMA
jgi:DNA-binding transcriptional LysR family regulator